MSGPSAWDRTRASAAIRSHPELTLHGAGQILALAARVLERPAQEQVVAREHLERLRPSQPARLVRGLGPAVRGRDHAVEHAPRQIGERGLALDDEGHKHRRPPLLAETHQLAGRRDLRLARDHAVAVRMDCLAAVVQEPDRAQSSETLDDARQVSLRGALRDLPDPAEERAPISLDPPGEKSVQCLARQDVEPPAQLLVRPAARLSSSREGEALDERGPRDEDAAAPQPLDDAHDDRPTALGRGRGHGAGRDRGAVVGLSDHAQPEERGDLGRVLAARLNACRVEVERFRIGAELIGDDVDHGRGHPLAGAQRAAEVAHEGELHREAEPVVRPATAACQGDVVWGERASPGGLVVIEGRVKQGRALGRGQDRGRDGGRRGRWAHREPPGGGEASCKGIARIGTAA